MPTNSDINWESILSKDNRNIEELNHEEIAILKEWATREHEQELYIREYPDKDINPFL